MNRNKRVQVNRSWHPYRVLQLDKEERTSWTSFPASQTFHILKISKAKAKRKEEEKEERKVKAIWNFCGFSFFR